MPFDADNNLISLDLKNDRRDELMQQVRDHYAEADSARGDWPTRHEKRYRRFLADRQLRGRGPWLNAPRIFTPDTQNVLDKIWSQLWTGVFPRFEALDMEPFDQAALPNVEKALQTERWCLRYLINDADLGGFAHISRMAIFDALLDSAGYLKVYPWRQPWRDAVPERLIRMDNTDEGMLLIPPGAKGLQYPEAAYVGEDVYVRWDDLLRMKRDGYAIPTHDECKAEPRQLTERQRVEEERTGRHVEPESNHYLVNEMHERFVLDPTKDEEEDDVIVSWFPHAAAEHQLARVILLKDRFPYTDRPRRPYFPIVVWQQPRQLRGLNAVDKIEQLQDLINRLTEQMVAFGDITLSPMFLYNAMLTGDIPDLTQAMPGQGVPVNDLGGVQFVPRASMNRHFLEQMTEHRIGIERTSKVSDVTMGLGPTRPNAPRTASGTAMLQQAQRQDFSILVGLLGLQFQAPLQFHWQLQQHYAPPGLKVPLKRVARTAGQPGGRGTPPPIPGVSTSSGLSEGAAAFPVPGMDGATPGLPAASPPGAASPFPIPGRESPDAASAMAEDLLAPEEGYWLAEDVEKKDLAGTFLIKLKINPDLPFDRQVLTQLGQWLYPLVAAKYPLGARLLLKRIFEINNQRGFDEIYPQAIAMLETQALFSKIIQTTTAEHAQASQVHAPPSAPPGPHPGVQQAKDQAAVHAAQQGMQRESHQTEASHMKLVQQVHALLQTLQGGQGDE